MSTASGKGPQRVPLSTSSSVGANGSVKVKAVLRARPMLNNEATMTNSLGRSLKRPSSINLDPTTGIARIPNPRNNNELLSYIFDGCYGPDATQLRLFAQDVVPIVERALEGYNATIFAYGNTGAGKTYTMEGTAENPGMIPLAVQYVLEAQSKRISSGASFPATLPEIHVSYLEIYKEKVYDLLSSNPTAADLPIREDAHRNILIPGLSCSRINSLADFDRLWCRGVANRSTAATNLNAHSSRSHSCLTVQVPLSSPLGQAKLHLIDLAGSEDNRRTANAGERLVESGAINRSLFVLGQVVDALNGGAARIPYRDSKLTRLLQDSLGGRAYSLIIANVAPTEGFLLDTYNTLNFASKTRLIENNVTMVEEPRSTSLRDDLDGWKNRKRAPSDSHEGGKEKRIKSSSPATLSSSVEVGKRKQRPIEEDKENNPFDKKAPGSLQNIILERRIEEKVAEKLREISHGTILSPLLKGDTSMLTSGMSKSPLMKAVCGIREKFPVLVSKAPRKKTSDDDPQVIAMLPLVEPDLLPIFNQGTLKEIKAVQEIGAKRAQAIIDHRNASGSLHSLTDLVVAGIISQKILGKIVLANALGRVEIRATLANHQQQQQQPIAHHHHRVNPILISEDQQQ